MFGRKQQKVHVNRLKPCFSLPEPTIQVEKDGKEEPLLNIPLPNHNNLFESKVTDLLSTVPELGEILGHQPEYDPELETPRDVPQPEEPTESSTGGIPAEIPEYPRYHTRSHGPPPPSDPNIKFRI